MTTGSKQRRNAFSIAIVLMLGIAALAMIALGIAGIAPRDIKDAFHSTPADGSWKATALDGLPVRSKNYLVVLRRGELVGGYDDCNGWCYQDEGPDKNGERKMLSTLVSCSADDEFRRLYWMLVHSPQLTMLGDNDLRLSRGGHEGRFHRCTPNQQRFRCVVVR